MKKNIFICFILSGLLLSGCLKKQQKEFNDDFKVLMGKQTDLWKHIVTNEDIGYLQLYERVYNSNKHLQKRKIAIKNIPEVIHFIWLGPKDFPRESIRNVISWIEKNPECKVKFWTDRERESIHPSIEMVYFDSYPFEELQEQFYQSKNYAERSDLLRYEILLNEGGLYVDHDVLCFESFAKLLGNYDFFCALEPPHSPIISSSISICNNIIGSVPGHLFLKETINNVKTRWDRIERSFPGSDQESTIYRVAHRTFASFDEAVRNNLFHSDLKNIVFPAGYFNNIGKNSGIFAHHFYNGTWYKTEDPFENLVRKQLDKMAKKSNKMLLLGGVSVFINLLLAICLILQHRMIKTSHVK